MDQYDLGQAAAPSLRSKWPLLTLGAACVRGVLPKERETVQTRKTRGRDAPGQPRFLREELKTGRRDELKKRGLDTDVAHDLLARVIFIQFLFQRRDSSGQPALNRDIFHRLWEEEHVLSKRYTSLPEILADKSDAYNLFRWLNRSSTGTCFPARPLRRRNEKPSGRRRCTR